MKRRSGFRLLGLFFALFLTFQAGHLHHILAAQDMTELPKIEEPLHGAGPIADLMPAEGPVDRHCVVELIAPCDRPLAFPLMLVAVGGCVAAMTQLGMRRIPLLFIRRLPVRTVFHVYLC